MQQRFYDVQYLHIVLVYFIVLSLISPEISRTSVVVQREVCSTNTFTSYLGASKSIFWKYTFNWFLDQTLHFLERGLPADLFNPPAWLRSVVDFISCFFYHNLNFSALIITKSPVSVWCKCWFVFPRSTELLQKDVQMVHQLKIHVPFTFNLAWFLAKMLFCSWFLLYIVRFCLRWWVFLPSKAFEGSGPFKWGKQYRLL